MDKGLVARLLLDLDEAADALGTPSDSALALRKLNTVARTLRAHYDDVETLLRQCAAEGMSKKDAARKLRISYYRFTLLTQAMPDLVWQDSNSLARQRYNETLRSQPVTEETQAKLAKGRAVMTENLRVHNICGVMATIREHRLAWGSLVSVGYSTINRRLSEGQSLYDAMFNGPRPSAVTKCARTNKHRARLKTMYGDQYHSRHQELRP